MGKEKDVSVNLKEKKCSPDEYIYTDTLSYVTK